MPHSQASEEIKRFLQEGVVNYAPAKLAIAEFERQTRSRLQTVLDEFADPFETFGLEIDSLNKHGSGADQLSTENSSAFIGLKKDHAQGLYASYNVGWDFSADAEEQLWVSANLYAGRKRADRNRFFEAIQRLRADDSKTYLEQATDGATSLSAYRSIDEFYNFGETFREVIQEWVGLLTAIGVRQFLSPPLSMESE